MVALDIINDIIRITYINICVYIVFLKIVNYKENTYRKIILMFIVSLIEEIIAIHLIDRVPMIMSMVVMYLSYGIIIGKITQNRYRYSIIITFISLTVTYAIYLFSLLIAAILLKILIPTIETDNIAIFIMVMIIQGICLKKLFNIRRFKNGFIFLQKADNIEHLGVFGEFFIVITLLIYSGVKEENSFFVNVCLAICIIIESICILTWITKKITKYYKQKLKENTIQELENEIKQKNEKISEILEENKAIATINHKYSSRITALEKFSAKILTKPEIISKMKTEFGEDFTEFEKQIKALSEEYKNEIKENVKFQNKIPKTGIFGIDNILEHLREEAAKENIDFDLKLNGSINYMVENVIDQSKLETLLGDHIKDAIIAIRNSDSNYRKILAILGIVDECYEVCIYDTGIEFEIDTLLKLGTEAVTTHKKTGGSGIGFMTTFETMSKTNASLIIEEKHKMNNTDFTKAVKIRFDGKNEYKIKSYKAEEIISKVKDNRIIIEHI